MADVSDKMSYLMKDSRCRTAPGPRSALPRLMRRWLVASASIALFPAAAAAQEVRSGGNGTIYMGAYNESVYVIDEATLEVTERIPVTSGIPNLMQLSPDNRTLYVRDAAMEHIEVVDLAEGRSVDSFTLSEGNTRVRIRSMAVDPGGEYVLLGARSYTKLLDRFEIGEFSILRVDLDTHEVTDTVPTSVGEQRQGANLMFSPDGDLLYFFGRDIIAVETENFTEVDRWELSQPLEEGLGRMNMSFQRSPYDDEGIFTNLFRMTDPVQGRQMMGIARVNLAEQDVDFYTLGPSERVSFALAPDGRKAYGLRSEIGFYEFWTFDLEGRRVESRVEFPGRPRMSLAPSSNGELLYIYNAGNTIDVYDADTHELLRTVWLDADMTRFLLVPGDAASNGGGS